MSRVEPEGFEDLWQLWRQHARHTDGRGKARPTYIKWLQEGADPADMLDGARFHIRSKPEKDRPYINLLSVYLNSERWVDECKQERDYQRVMAERAARQPKTSPAPIPEPVQAEPRVSPERVKALMEQFGFAKPEEMH